MGRADPHRREPGAGFETALVAGGGLVLAAGVATWAGARLAVTFTGGHVDGGIDVWLRAAARLARGQPPAQAWAASASGLPAPWIYWTCTTVVALLVAAV